MIDLIGKFSERKNLIKENWKIVIFHKWNKRRIIFSVIFLVLFIQLTVIGSNFSLQHSNQVQFQSMLVSKSELLNFNNQINSKFSTLNANQLQFGLGTYFGGSNYDFLTGLVTDNYGNIYVTGYTSSSNFPTRNAYNATYGGNTDSFVAKFNSSGFPIFSTFLGGTQDDEAAGIAVDNAQNIYVTGVTFSPNFPVKNAYQSALKGTKNGFVTKFNSQGSIVFSTYLGGSASNNPSGIAVDKFGNSYIVGYTTSNDFPVKNAWNKTYGGGSDGFVTKFDPQGYLIFSTFIGGSLDDLLYSVAVDNNQTIFASGESYSKNFPQINSIQPLKGTANAVYVKMNATGSLIFSTLYGGSSFEAGYNLAIDKNDNVVITGVTTSSDLPLKNAFQSNYNGTEDVFVTKFSSSNTVVFSTYLGGNNSDFAHGASFDSAGNIYIDGITYSNNFYVSTDAYQKTNPGVSMEYVFLTKFSPTGSVLYSSYFGGTNTESAYGLSVDSNNNVFLGISTYSTDMPTKNAYYPTEFGDKDVFIAGFYSSLGPITTTSSSGNNGQTASSGLTSQTVTSSTPTTSANSSNSINLQDLLSSPEFLGLGAVAVLSVLLNVLLLIRRRK